MQASFHLREKKFELCLLAMLVIVIFGPVTLLYHDYPSSDYYLHAKLAWKMFVDHVITAPHFLFHLLTVLFYVLTPLRNIVVAGIIITLFFHVFTAWVIYARAHKELQINTYLLLLLALSLILVGPVSLLALADGHLYFGYIGINVFHNPTIVVLKPFALLLFFTACAIFDEISSESIGTVFAAMTITVLAALAKPSFIICLLPALALAVLFQVYRQKPVKWRLLIAGIVAPALLVIGGQYLLTYSSSYFADSGNTESSIIIAPFAVMGARSFWLFPKFLLSVLFPLAVVLCYFKDARNDLQLKFAGLVFFFGAIFTYFFAESGPRFYDGNFGWSGQISLFTLFVVSTLFFLRQSTTGGVKEFLSRKRNIACAVVFFLHLFSNLVLYRGEIIRTTMFW